jgi:hypothetical protein
MESELAALHREAYARIKKSGERSPKAAKRHFCSSPGELNVVLSEIV